MFGQVAPVRTDVTQRGTVATLSRIGTPGVDIWITHPVLQIKAVDEADGSCFAASNHAARLLYERISAIVEGNGMRYFCGQGCISKGLAFRRVEREWLVGDDMLAGSKYGERDRQVQVIRRGVVNDVDVRIGDQRVIVAVGPIHFVFTCLFLGRLLRRSRYRNHIHITQPPHCVDMMCCYKTRTNQAHTNFLHRCFCLNSF